MCFSDVNNPLGSQLIRFDWNCLCDKYYYCNTCLPQNPSLQTTLAMFSFSLSCMNSSMTMVCLAVSTWRIKTLPAVHCGRQIVWVLLLFSLVLTALPGGWAHFFQQRDRTDPKTDKNCPACHRFTLITILIIDECSIPAFPSKDPVDEAVAEGRGYLTTSSVLQWEDPNTEWTIKSSSGGSITSHNAPWKEYQTAELMTCKSTNYECT